MNSIAITVALLMTTAFGEFKQEKCYIVDFDFETHVWIPEKETVNQGDTLKAVFDPYLDGYMLTDVKVEESVIVVIKQP